MFGGARGVSRRTSQSRRALLIISGLVLATSGGWAQVSQSGDVYPFYDTPLPNPWRTYSSPLVIGLTGVGTVSVGQNGSVITGSTKIGDDLGGDGTLSVAGEGATAIVGSLAVGWRGRGYMVISQKGYVYGGPLGGSSVVGAASTSEGTVLVDGEDSLWGAGPLTVGNFGNGFLTIQNKGKVTSNESYIGMYDGSESIVTVTGAGSEWSASGMYPESGGITVGSAGKGTLLVSGGAKVSSGMGTVGDSSDGIGLATITGTDSLWSINTDIRIGRASGQDNKLNITSGGKVTSGSGMLAGSNYGTRGTVTVNGTASTWENTATLSVGEYGGGYLNVENGGQVSNTIGYLGNINQSRGEAIVTGSGSVWTNSDALYVGNGGRGILQIRNAGRVVADFVGMGMTGGADGSIQLDGTADHRGVLETHYITEGESNAGGKITFNGGILRARGDEANFLRGFETDDVVIEDGGAFIDTQAFAIGIATSLTGTGGLTKLGSGALALTGVNTYSGPTTIAAGTLVNNGSLSSDLVVASGSTLKGTGTYHGVVTIQEGGTLAPGNSPGTVTFEGGLTLENDVILSLELGTAASDLIVVSGGDLLGPTSGTILLQIVDAGDFAAGLYTLIDATGASFIDLTIAQFTLNAAPAGYEYELLRTGDLYQLQVDAVPEPATVGLLAGSLLAVALITRRRAGGVA